MATAMVQDIGSYDAAKVMAANRSYDCHVSPVLDDGGDVTVFRIPNEEGYFPTGYSAVAPLVWFNNATLYQINPRFVSNGATTMVAANVPEEDFPKEVANGTLVLCDPSPGTASEVSLVGNCDCVCFYVMSDNAAMRLSETEFVLLLPNDCILIDFSSSDAPIDMLLHLEAILAVRTKFCDASNEKTAICKPEPGREALVPDDPVCRAVFKTSKWVGKACEKAGKAGSRQINKYGEKKVASIEKTEEKKIGKNTLRLAKGAKVFGKTTNVVASKVSDKVSSSVGKAVANRVKNRSNSKETEESSKKKKAKQLLLTAVLAYGEVSDGMGEGYNSMSTSAKEQASSFVAKKYGKDAAQLVRHTAGATINFGRAALTGRQIINVKGIVKSNTETMFKEAYRPT